LSSSSSSFPLFFSFSFTIRRARGDFVYAPHFVAALAIKSTVPRASLAALLTGAFLPDVLWIVLARIGVEPAQTPVFFDDWSHSLASVLVLATVFAALFLRAGGVVFVAVWLAVGSHFVLDFPVHPKRLALYPMSNIHLGWDLWAWGTRPGWLSAANYWWLQSVVLLVLLLLYVNEMRRARAPVKTVLAACVVVTGAQLLMLSMCISY
jgi:hypothetical protein